MKPAALRAPSPEYFATAQELYRWLARHHATAPELWVGFHKKQPGKTFLTYAQALDEALCFGWIDGVRKSVDADRYTIRFTPRTARSKWSAVNIRRLTELEAEGRVHDAGRAAFAKRDRNSAAAYSHENKDVVLPAAAAAQLRANAKAWAFFQAQPPSYRRAATWWIVSAKRLETQARRLAQLIQASARERRVPPLRRPGQD